MPRLTVERTVTETREVEVKPVIVENGSHDAWFVRLVESETGQPVHCSYVLRLEVNDAGRLVVKKWPGPNPELVERDGAVALVE